VWSWYRARPLPTAARKRSPHRRTLLPAGAINQPRAPAVAPVAAGRITRAESGYPTAVTGTASYSPDDPKPLSGYAILLFIFHVGVALIAALVMRSRKRMPESIPAADIALLSIGTFKVSRLVTKER
jgi:hypothetical protein